MAIDRDPINPSMEETLELREIEMFRDHILFPATTYLSRGAFSTVDMMPGDDFTLSAKRGRVDKIARYGVEATCMLVMDPDELEVPTGLTYTIEVMHDIVLPPDESELIIKEALATIGGGSNRDMILDPESGAAAWDSRIFIIDNDPKTPLLKHRTTEIQDGSGAILWTDAELKDKNDMFELSEADREAFYEMQRGMAGAMSWRDTEIITAALLGLGLPETELRAYARNLLS